MAKTVRPMERIEELDKLWTWFERFGLLKTVLTGAIAGGVFTYLVSRFQHFPRWLILSLVFLVSSLALVALVAGIVWLLSLIQRKMKESVSDNPLRRRVIALEQSVGSREISEAQRKHLIAELSKHPGRIRISAVNPDDDAAQYAEQFASLLREAGWNVWGVDRPYTKSLWNGNIGLILSTTENLIAPYPPAQALAEAMEAANIPSHYFITFELVKDSCELFVGHRGQEVY
ncbi:MAG: hypothetical protein WCE63_17045 [Acidobacteriaceae bacterium]